MKFGHTFSVIRVLENTDLNVTDVLCSFNRECDEIMEAEEYLNHKSGCDDFQPRAIYSVTDRNIDHGYYIMVCDDAFMVAMGISNFDKPKNYHMMKEIHRCESNVKFEEKEPKHKSFEMFRISENSPLGKGIMKTFNFQKKETSYRVSNNKEIPVTVTLKDGQIIFSQN